LPFGDSITDGVGSTDSAGYRSPLFKLVVAASQKINYVGSRSSGPTTVTGKPFPKNHEGHPGWTIDSGYVSYGDGISTLIPSPAFNTLPHIVLLMIGTNDISGTKGTDTIADRLDVLLGKVVAAAPKALIVVAQVTPIRWNPAALSTYNAKIPTLIQKRAANGQHLVSVDMSKMPAAALSSDGIHPNDTGYAYMADVWYSAIKTYLPK
jgi:lysophospholipase L1-like esterase